jgi:hypothetical protein
MVFKLPHFIRHIGNEPHDETLVAQRKDSLGRRAVQPGEELITANSEPSPLLVEMDRAGVTVPGMFEAEMAAIVLVIPFKGDKGDRKGRDCVTGDNAGITNLPELESIGEVQHTTRFSWA